jgi:hypothetical protein
MAWTKTHAPPVRSGFAMRPHAFKSAACCCRCCSSLFSRISRVLKALAVSHLPPCGPYWSDNYQHGGPAQPKRKSRSWSTLTTIVRYAGILSRNCAVSLQAIRRFGWYAKTGPCSERHLNMQRTAHMRLPERGGMKLLTMHSLRPAWISTPRKTSRRRCGRQVSMYGGSMLTSNYMPRNTAKCWRAIGARPRRWVCKARRG